MNITGLCSVSLAANIMLPKIWTGVQTLLGDPCFISLKSRTPFGRGVSFLLGTDVAYRRTLGPTVGRLVCGFEVKCGQTCQKCGFDKAKAVFLVFQQLKRGYAPTRSSRDTICIVGAFARAQPWRGVHSVHHREMHPPQRICVPQVSNMPRGVPICPEAGL